jgi:ABC-type multidrug transport system fused ATPase/permease subunit
VHFQLGRIQRIDFVEQDFEPAVRQLVASIERAVARVGESAGSTAPGERFGAGAAPSAAACPYRGLHAFREEDAPYFFGREVFAKRLVATLDAKPMVGVIGPSGSGKSSVVNAGMLKS